MIIFHGITNENFFSILICALLKLRMKNCIDRIAIIDYRNIFIPYFFSVHLHLIIYFRSYCVCWSFLLLLLSLSTQPDMQELSETWEQENKNKNKIKRPRKQIKIKFYELELWKVHERRSRERVESRNMKTANKFVGRNSLSTSRLFKCLR